MGRRLTARRCLATLAFLVAVAAFLWPIHYRAATGVSVDGGKNQFTLTGFTDRSCPWRVQLGHGPGTAPSPPPADADVSLYLLDSYNDGQCAAGRYDRSSAVLLFVLIGFGFTVSEIRTRASRPARARIPATA